jgi:GT2 family glycosyltransferase
MITTGSISVVIPTRERRASVMDLLRALERQTLPPDEFEVIVSIDGSRDGTREAIAGFSALYALRAVWHPHSGRAAACNSGIRVAQGDLLVLLDDDMDPDPDLLAVHRHAHLDGPRCAVMGAVRVKSDVASPPVVQYTALKFERIMQRLGRLEGRIGFNDAYTGNFSIPRRLLQETGGFDESFTAYGCEDGELAFRLQKAGVALRYNPKARATQRCLKHFADMARDEMNHGRMAVLLARKHPEAYEVLGLRTRGEASRKWRLARGSLLELASVMPGTPSEFIRGVEWLERRGLLTRPRYLTLALDYLYWAGVQEGLRENGLKGRSL